MALAIQLAYATVALGFTVGGAYEGWFKFGGGRPKPPLYGLWNVEEYSIDGQSRPPLTTDNERWRWVYIRTDRFSVQKMDDSFTFFLPEFDNAKGTVALNNFQGKDRPTTLNFQQPASEELNVDGEMDAHKIHVHLHRIDPAKKFHAVVGQVPLDQRISGEPVNVCEPCPK